MDSILQIVNFKQINTVQVNERYKVPKLYGYPLNINWISVKNLVNAKHVTVIKLHKERLIISKMSNEIVIMNYIKKVSLSLMKDG